MKIELKKIGELENYITSEQLTSATSLEISGPMTDEDVVLLGKYTRSRSNISAIDMEGVTNLTSIDHNAFENCKNLEEIKLPQTIARIGDHAFDNCISLKGQKLPNSVEIVGDRAYSGCENMTSINIPNKVSYIGVGAFYGCYKLTNIDVDKNNARYENRGGVLFDNVDKTLLRYIQTKTVEKEFKTPAGVVHIGNYAFDGCKGLVSVEVSEGCTDLGERSFTRCNDLRKISFPASMNNLDYNAFDDCDALETIVVDKNNTTYKSDDGVLYIKDMKTLAICPKSKKSPFYFPETVEKINDGAFSGCKNIKSVVLPHKLKTIGNKVFSDCDQLHTVNMPNSLQHIGDFAFANCKKLSKIVVYNSVPPKCGVSPFASVDFKNCTVFVPVDAEMDFRKDYGWDSFDNIEESVKMTLGSNFTIVRSTRLAIKRFFLTHFHNK